MCNSKGAVESKSSSVEATQISNNNNASIHFENIYNFHEEHSNSLKQLRSDVQIGIACVLGFMILIIVSIVVYVLIKKYRNSRRVNFENQVEKRAREIAVVMVEKASREN